MFCTSCGNQLPDDATFCGQCGRRVGSSARRNAPADPVLDAPTRVNAALPAGTVLLGRYRIVRHLGMGGMGRVYEAQDAHLNNERVAVKILRDELAGDQTALARLRREVMLARKLRHDGIVAVHTLETQGDELSFLVMEFVEGQSLAERVGDTVQPEDEVRRIALALCDALAHAHGKGVLHRDIKPANVLVQADGHLKLADFGLAAEAKTSLVSRGHQMDTSGTLEYMAPEQLDDGDASVASDLYQLGVMLYQLASGRLPFRAPSPLVVMEQIRRKAPARIEVVGEALNTVILRLLDKDPKARFQAATAARAALQDSGDSAELQDLRRKRDEATAADRHDVSVLLGRTLVAIAPGSTADSEAVRAAEERWKRQAASNRVCLSTDAALTESGESIAIDIGNVFSRVALWTGDGPRLIEDASTSLIPTLVARDPDGTLAGEFARRAVSISSSISEWFLLRRIMAANSENGLLTHGPTRDRTLQLLEELSLLMQHFRNAAEGQMSSPVGHAAVLVPAVFGYRERRLITRSAMAAGLKPERMLDPSTAAALWYQHVVGVDGANRTAAFLDVRSGFASVTVADSGEGVVEVKDVSGVAWADPDFDLATVDLPAEVREAASSYAPLKVGMQRDAWDLNVDHLLGESLRRAGVDSGDLDAVVLYGGSADIPSVKQAVLDRFGSKIEIWDQPDAPILGASLLTAIRRRAVTDLLFLDALPYSVGVETAGGALTIIVQHGTTVPTRESWRFRGSPAGLRLGVYSGDSEGARAGDYLGGFDVDVSDSRDIEVTIDVGHTNEITLTSRGLDSGQGVSVTLAELIDGRTSRESQAGETKLPTDVDDEPARDDEPASPTPETAGSPPLEDRRVNLIDGKEMVWIPPGEFLMGSPAGEEGRSDNETQHRQRIATGFWLDVTPVTNAEYAKFVEANPAWRKGNAELVDSDYLSEWKGDVPPEGKRDHPVQYVSWHAARAYCAWTGKRLPTEAEWEYSARAGTTTAYWWGASFDAARAANDRDTEPVNRAARVNPWGPADMLGNVWEWTSSKYRAYPYRSDDGREVATGVWLPILRGADRVVRGGAVSGGGRFLRSANRGSYRTEGCVPGFRCAQ